jgi:hypothetical protein
MTYYIRYTTATHKALRNAKFETLREAREEVLHNDLNWYLQRLAVIVEADDGDEAMTADCVECVSDLVDYALDMPVPS